MIKRIDHIAIAVNNIEESLEIFERVFKLKASKIEKVLQRGVKLVFLDSKDGNTKLELIEPISGVENPISKFLKKRGEGIHHICFEVDNIKDCMEELKENRMVLIDQEPKEGAGGTLTCFISPKSAKGVLIELKEYIIFQESRSQGVKDSSFASMNNIATRLIHLFKEALRCLFGKEHLARTFWSLAVALAIFFFWNLVW